MKVMLRCDQTRLYIDKADEIYVPSKRVDLIEEIHTQYPNKTILLDNIDGSIAANDIKMYSGLCRGQLKVLVGLDTMEHEPLVRRVLFYPMTSLLEMAVAYSHGIREFYIGAELFHQMRELKNFKDRNKCTFRLVANTAKVPQELYYAGAFLLPQELDMVEDVIDYVEFKTEDAKQESAYYRIYFEDKEWQGELGQLITDIDSDVTTRMIEPLSARFRCNLACLSNGRCHLCQRNIELADESLYKNILDKAQE